MNDSTVFYFQKLILNYFTYQRSSSVSLLAFPWFKSDVELLFYSYIYECVMHDSYYLLGC
jgi:hypothetical protein